MGDVAATSGVGFAAPSVARLRDPERTKASILAAGRAEFVGRGFEGARINTIAARAGANKQLLYYYFGNKEALYRAVLLDAFREIRSGEAALCLPPGDPVVGMDALVRFTFRQLLDNPWFTRLLGIENLEHARFLKTIAALHSPLLAKLTATLDAGVATGVFRRDVDAVQLYISVAALGSFFVSNRATLAVVFGRDLGTKTMAAEREEHAVAMVLGFLRTGATG